MLLTPATICLAVPLYEQVHLLKKHSTAVLAGVISGAVGSMASVAILSFLFHLSHTHYVTLLPKSITTAIGMDISQEFGGIVTITVTVIIITGIIGNVIAQPLCKLFRIHHPIAKGIAIGSSSHAIGTVKAMEMGEIEGAMSSLAIVVSGIITFFFFLFFFFFFIKLIKFKIKNQKPSFLFLRRKCFFFFFIYIYPLNKSRKKKRKKTSFLQTVDKGVDSLFFI